MALIVKDRVQETTATTGTGTLTLGGAVLGFQTFAAIGNGNTTYYAINDPIAGDWEVGIGTYTSSGTTLSRDTVLSSSNGGSLVPFASGTKNVFCTYPSERSVYRDTANTYTVQQAFDAITANSIALTTGTITTDPVNNTDIVNKQYADAIASGIHFHEAVAYATTAALPACTYNNGTSGVGATLTGDANGALTIDSHTFTSPTDNGTRVLIKNEVNGAHNGVYTLTQAGNSSPGAPFILTRATDFDTVGTGVDQIDEGDFFLVTSGVVNLNTAWVQQTAPPITVGTTPIVFQQFSAPITYTAGTGLNESPSYTFNIANTAVTPATYGTQSSVGTFTVNAQGQITNAVDTAIAISSAAVSGLAASATTDTTDANNITSGSLGTSRLSGSYTGVTGVGTLTAGTWNANTIAAIYGGTGLSSFTAGDLIYANSSTTLAALADVAVGNALISGGIAAAPSWGKIGLATHVSGTLPIANGGTGSTSTTFVDLATNVTGTLPVANGGTGQTTYTNGQLLIGNTTGNTLTKATLTQGTGITVTNGTGSITIDNAGVTSVAAGTGISVSASTGGVTISSTASGGGDFALRAYASPNTWTKPAGLKQVKVTVVGAGGNGGTAPATPGNDSRTGGGGGGGGAAIEWISAPSIPGPVAVTAGGGTNSFGAFCSATAGGAGGNAAVGGSGGAGSGGTFNVSGGGGGGGSAGVGSNGNAGGTGGVSILGGGGVGGFASFPGAVVGAAGGSFGGGGGGGSKVFTTGSAGGGAGAGGIVIVEEFY
jgi:hypothetical protein